MSAGKKIRLRGQGEPGARGGKAGDILLTVHVESHPFFRRRGNHLEVTVPVTLAEAVQGAKVDVPSPHGTIALKVPPGTSSGKKLRIKGYGVPNRDGGRGDLYADVQIVLPESIDPSTVKTIHDLNLGPANPRAALKW
jgi:DnaJ-class molecular chaperone